MASFANAFDLLKGAESQLNAKKKKNKNKKTEGAAAPAAPEPVVVAAPKQTGNAVVDVSEAAAIFERAAREAKTFADKNRLFKDWIRQVWLLNNGHAATFFLLSKMCHVTHNISVEY